MNKNIFFNIFLKTKCSVHIANSSLGTCNENWISIHKLFLSVQYQAAESLLLEIQQTLFGLEEY